MKKENTIEILKSCINKLENMSKEDFDKIIKEKGLDDKKYDTSEYLDENMKIIFPIQKRSK